MSDDSFIREVDEELRSEQVQQVWQRYGKLIVGGAIAIVLAVGAYRYYHYYTAQQAATAGDAFMSAVELAESGKVDEALAALETIEKESTPAYQALAGMRRAAELAKQGKSTDAIAVYDAIAGNNAIEQNLRAIARLRGGLLTVDVGSVSDVLSRITPLLGPGALYRNSAKEALALAHYKADELEKAAKLYAEIRNDSETPRALGGRATLMLELIASQGGPAVPPATPGTAN